MAAVALAVAVAVIVVLVLRSQSSPSTAGSQAAGSTGLGVATVSRRNLVATDTESGTLAYAGAQTVYNRLSGTITSLPKVGQVIKPGHVLFRVGDQPVMLMNGSTPAYRDLGPDDPPGPDIAQLNRNLIKLGFDPDGIVADDEWQPATSDGVEVLQESLDEAPTGTLTLGQLVFLPGPQLVSSVDAIVGGTGGGTAGGGSGGGSDSGGSGGSSDSGGSAEADLGGDGPPAAEPVSLAEDAAASSTTTTSASATTPTTSSSTSRSSSTSTTTTTTTSSQSPTTKSLSPPTGARPKHPTSMRTAPPSSNSATVASDRSLSTAIGRLSSEIARLRGQLRASKADNHPSSSSHGSASSGEPSATAVLQTSSTRLDVTVDLPAGSQSEAVVGKSVDVEMPAGNTVKGTVVSVSRVAQSSSSDSSGGSAGGGSSSTVPVTIRLHDRRAGDGLDQAAVSVDFVQASARHVLSVPVTALVATSGQTYALQEAAVPHRLIGVHTGLFAAGYVQVSGRGVVPGLRVTDSEG
jgi:hypothetical protein